MKTSSIMTVLLGISTVGVLHAGCIVRNVVNYTKNSTVRLRTLRAPAQVSHQSSPRITEFNETVGEYIIFEVQKRLTADSTICKQYKIAVDEFERDIGTIRLLQSDRCGKDAVFDYIVQEFVAVDIKRCVLDLHVYDADDVRMRIIKQEAQAD